MTKPSRSLLVWFMIGLPVISGCLSLETTPPPNETKRGARSFGGAGDEVPSAVDIAPDGRIAITGAFKGDADLGDGSVYTNMGAGRNLFVNLRTKTGMPLRSHVLASADDQWGTSAHFDALGDLLVGCGFSGTLAFDGLQPMVASGNYNACAVKLDHLDGDAVWARQFGDSMGFQAALAITTAKDEHVLLGGTFAGSLPMPTEALEVFDGKDAFMLELSP